MSPTLTSQGLVLATATAMAVSAATALLFDLLRDKYFPPPTSQFHHKPTILKSCLSAGSKKIDQESPSSSKKKKKKKLKKVKFAEDVKDPKGNGELYRKKGRKCYEELQKNYSCGNEIIESQKVPENHAALYNGILKDRVRVQRMGYSC